MKTPARPPAKAKVPPPTGGNLQAWQREVAELNREIQRIKQWEKHPGAVYGTAQRMITERIIQKKRLEQRIAAAEKGLRAAPAQPKPTERGTTPAQQAGKPATKARRQGEVFGPPAPPQPSTRPEAVRNRLLNPQPTRNLLNLPPPPQPKFDLQALGQAAELDRQRRAYAATRQRVAGPNTYNVMTRKPYSQTGSIKIYPAVPMTPGSVVPSLPQGRIDTGVDLGKIIQGFASGVQEIEEGQAARFEEWLVEQAAKRPDILPPLVGTGAQGRKLLAHINQVMGTNKAFDQYRARVWAKFDAEAARFSSLASKNAPKAPTAANWKQLYPQAKSFREAANTYSGRYRDWYRDWRTDTGKARFARSVAEQAAREFAYPQVKAFIEGKIGKPLTPVQERAVKAGLAWEAFRLPERRKVQEQLGVDIATTIATERLMDLILPGSGTVRGIARTGKQVLKQAARSTLRETGAGALQQTITYQQVHPDANHKELSGQALVGGVFGGLFGGAIAGGGVLKDLYRGAKAARLIESAQVKPKVQPDAELVGSLLTKDQHKIDAMRKQAEGTGDSFDAIKQPDGKWLAIVYRPSERVAEASLLKKPGARSAARLRRQLTPEQEEILRKGEAKGARFGTVEGLGTVEIGREENGKTFVRAIDNPGKRLAVPSSQVRELPRRTQSETSASVRTDGAKTLPVPIPLKDLTPDEPVPVQAGKPVPAGEQPPKASAPELAGLPGATIVPEPSNSRLAVDGKGTASPTGTWEPTEQPGASATPRRTPGEAPEPDTARGRGGEVPGNRPGAPEPEGNPAKATGSRRRRPAGGTDEASLTGTAAIATTRAAGRSAGRTAPGASTSSAGAAPPGGPPPASEPPRGAPPGAPGQPQPRTTTAPAQKPGAVGVSGAGAGTPEETPGLGPQRGRPQRVPLSQRVPAPVTPPNPPIVEPELPGPPLARQLPPGQKVRHITGLREAADWLPWFLAGGGPLPREIKAGAKPILAEGRGPYSVVIELDPQRVTGRQLHTKSEVYGLNHVGPDAVTAFVVPNPIALRRYRAKPGMEAAFDFENARKVKHGYRVLRKPTHPTKKSIPSAVRDRKRRLPNEAAVWYSPKDGGSKQTDEAISTPSSHSRKAPAQAIDSAILSLQGEAGRLWTEGDARSELITQLLKQWNATDIPGYLKTLRVLSDSISEGLTALELPPGKVWGPWIDRVGGQASTDHRLHIRLDDLFLKEAILDKKNPDLVWLVLIHEHLHARMRFDQWDAALERFRHEGYEEALVETLTQWVCSRAGLDYSQPAYTFYVRSIEIGADVLGLDLEQLLRGLWRQRPGTVRSAFAALVEGMLNDSGRKLSESQRLELGRVADRLFHSKRVGRKADESMEAFIMALWGRVIQ